MFAFGPIEHYVPNPLLLYSYVFMGQLAIFVGYNLGVSERSCGYSGFLPIPTLLKTAIIVAIITLVITYVYRNYANASISEALADPKIAYDTKRLALREREEAPLASVILALTGPIVALLLPMGIVYWRRMNRMWRTLWITGLLSFPLESIFTGTAKSFFDIIVIIPWLLWLRTNNSVNRKAAASQKHTRYRHPQRSTFRKYLPVALTIALLVAGFAYLNLSRQSRYSLSGDQYPLGTTGWSADMYGVQLPGSIEYTVYNLAGYWAAGYQGLSGCLELPFEWCYGCGHSSFWMRYAGEFSNASGNIWEMCYPARLEAATGYSATSSWHTIYPWLASDLTFPGALLFIGLMAYFLAMVWRDSLLGENPFAVACFAQLLLMFYYIPANDCRLAFSEELITFWTLLAVWLLTRKRKIVGNIIRRAPAL